VVSAAAATLPFNWLNRKGVNCTKLAYLGSRKLHTIINDFFDPTIYPNNAQLTIAIGFGVRKVQLPLTVFRFIDLQSHGGVPITKIYITTLQLSDSRLKDSIKGIRHHHSAAPLPFLATNSNTALLFPEYLRLGKSRLV
jgi:hypothetical protein